MTDYLLSYDRGDARYEVRVGEFDKVYTSPFVKEALHMVGQWFEPGDTLRWIRDIE